MFATVEECKMEDAERMMKFNYLMPLELTKEALPHLRKTKGNVVFITSAVREFDFDLLKNKTIKRIKQILSSNKKRVKNKRSLAENPPHSNVSSVL